MVALLKQHAPESDSHKKMYENAAVRLHNLTSLQALDRQSRNRDMELLLQRDREYREEQRRLDTERDERMIRDLLQQMDTRDREEQQRRDRHLRSLVGLAVQMASAQIAGAGFGGRQITAPDVSDYAGEPETLWLTTIIAYCL